MASRKTHFLCTLVLSPISAATNAAHLRKTFVKGGTKPLID